MNMQFTIPKEGAKAKAAWQMAGERTSTVAWRQQGLVFTRQIFTWLHGVFARLYGIIQIMIKKIQAPKKNAGANLIVGTALKTGVLPCTHYGIYAGSDMVIHNSIDFLRVVCSPWHDFAKNRAVHVSDITGGDPYQAFLNAKASMGKPYNLFNFNCEHFVRYCHGLPITSHQTKKIVSGGLGLAVASQIREPALRIPACFFSAGVAFAPETEDPIEMGAKFAVGALAVYALFQALKSA